MIQGRVNEEEGNMWGVGEGEGVRREEA